MAVPPSIFASMTGPRSGPAIMKEIPYFTEKRILVTGASSGVGRAVATWYVSSADIVGSSTRAHTWPSAGGTSTHSTNSASSSQPRPSSYNVT